MDDFIVQFNNIFCINDVFNERRASVTSSMGHITARSSSLRTNHDEDGVIPIQHPMWVHIPVVIQRLRALQQSIGFDDNEVHIDISKSYSSALINVSPIPLYNIHGRIVKFDGNCSKCVEDYISK